MRTGPALLLALIASLAGGARAEAPGGPGIVIVEDGEALCREAIRFAERQEGLPRGLLEAWAETARSGESGLWPWRVRFRGEVSRFRSEAEMRRSLPMLREAAREGGQPLGAGCLLTERSAPPEVLADPVQGAVFEARRLATAARRLGSWTAAVTRDAADPPAFGCRVADRLAEIRGDARSYEAYAASPCRAPAVTGATGSR